jgi:transglutaminase-like putative cysteine protease
MKTFLERRNSCITRAPRAAPTSGFSEAKLWSREVDHFAEPTKPLSDAVAGLVRPGDSDLDKAKKIYQAVEALDNTDFSRQRGEAEIKQLGLRTAKRAEDTWVQKSGSRQDITLLYIAMARAAGLTAYDMKVRNRDRGNFQPGYLFFGQLDDDIVILTINLKTALEMRSEWPTASNKTGCKH